MSSSVPPVSLRTRLSALLHQRCARCFKGPLYETKWGLAMHTHCPVCGLKYAREPGYFFGAMFFSYFLSVPFYAILVFSAWALLPTWPLEVLVPLMLVPFLCCVPLMFRYSRALWLHLDWFIDPETQPME